MLAECLSKKASKKQKALAPKLVGLGEDIKKAVLKLYLTRQKVKHQIYCMIRKFRNSYLHSKDHKKQDDFINRIFTVRERLIEIDTLAFKGIEFDEDPVIMNLTVSFFYQSMPAGASHSPDGA